MPDDHKKLPRMVSRNEWLAARQTVKKSEEGFARDRQALIAKWRDLPMVKADDNFIFEGPAGEVRLIDFFGGRGQLLVYHFWFQPDEEPCPGCSEWTYDLGELGGNFANLHKHDTALAFISRAPSAQIEAVKTQRGWIMPWFSMIDDHFDRATGYNGWAQISVFIRQGETVFLANVIDFSDLTTIGNHWTMLERTPLSTDR